MKSAFRNENGVTLVELLGALALLGIILLLISNVHIFGQKQFVNQTAQINHESNVRYAMNVITKEIRTATSVSVSNNVITTETSTFKLVGNELYQGSTVVEEGIEEFIVQQAGNKISIKIKSVPNQAEKVASLSTNLYIRE